MHGTDKSTAATTYHSHTDFSAHIDSQLIIISLAFRFFALKKPSLLLLPAGFCRQPNWGGLIIKDLEFEPLSRDSNLRFCPLYDHNNRHIFSKRVKFDWASFTKKAMNTRHLSLLPDDKGEKRHLLKLQALLAKND
jgi:hypothetical protein